MTMLCLYVFIMATHPVVLKKKNIGVYDNSIRVTLYAYVHVIFRPLIRLLWYQMVLEEFTISVARYIT